MIQIISSLSVIQHEQEKLFLLNIIWKPFYPYQLLLVWLIHGRFCTYSIGKGRTARKKQSAIVKDQCQCTLLP